MRFNNQVYFLLVGYCLSYFCSLREFGSFTLARQRYQIRLNAQVALVYLRCIALNYIT